MDMIDYNAGLRIVQLQTEETFAKLKNISAVNVTGEGTQGDISIDTMPKSAYSSLNSTGNTTSSSTLHVSSLRSYTPSPNQPVKGSHRESINLKQPLSGKAKETLISARRNVMPSTTSLSLHRRRIKSQSAGDTSGNARDRISASNSTTSISDSKLKIGKTATSSNVVSAAEDVAPIVESSSKLISQIRGRLATPVVVANQHFDAL